MPVISVFMCAFSASFSRTSLDSC